MTSLNFYKPTHSTGIVNILGVPVDVGTDGHGGADAPRVLRSLGLAACLQDAGFTANDLGDIACPPRHQLQVGSEKMKYAEGIAEVARASAALIQSAVARGEKVVAIGGDHAMSVGTIAGASAAIEGELGVIWIDAHADIHTDKTTSSGNVHGMPAAAAMGIGNPLLTDIIASGKKVNPKNFLFIGLKDIDPEEIETMERVGVQVITMMDIAAKGIGCVMEAVDVLRSQTVAIWVSQDIDAIDAADAPGTLMATPGGITYREITNIARYIGRTCQVVGVDLAELVPSRDKGAQTSELALELILLFLGGEYSWYTQYMKKYPSA